MDVVGCVLFYFLLLSLLFILISPRAGPCLRRCCAVDADDGARRPPVQPRPARLPPGIDVANIIPPEPVLRRSLRVRARQEAGYAAAERGPARRGVRRGPPRGHGRVQEPPP